MPLEAYHPAKGYCHVGDLLYAVNIGGKGSHYHAALGLVKVMLEGFADAALGRGMAVVFNVGAVAHKGQHAPGAVIGKAGNVDGLAVNGGIVHLKVARMENYADRRGYA